MIRVEIKSAAVQRFVSKQEKPYFKQTAYAFLYGRDEKPEPYPREIKFMVPKDERLEPIPFAPGNYSLAPSSFRVGRYSDLEIGFLNLVPLKSNNNKG